MQSIEVALKILCVATRSVALQRLGRSFDTDLKFRTHIVDVAKAVSSMCDLILRVFSLQEKIEYLRDLQVWPSFIRKT